MKIRFAAAPNVLSSVLNPQATQADQKMQFFRGNQQQPQQSRSAACDMIPNQQNFTKQDERFNHLLGLPNRASSRYFQERPSTVAFFLNFFAYIIKTLLKISSVFTEL